MARSKQFDPAEALERAMVLFWERGYRNTTMDELVKATGVVRASLYSTFGNKQKLFGRALDRYGALRAAAVDRQSAPVEMLREYLEAALAEARGVYPAGCLLFGTTAEYATLPPAVQAQVDAHLDRVGAFFRFCVAQIAPPEAVDRLTHVLQGANAAIFTLSRIGADDATLRDIIDSALDQVRAAAEGSPGSAPSAPVDDTSA